MRNMLKRVIFIVLAAWLAAGCKVESGKNGKTDSVVQFTILQLNDVYEIGPVEQGKYGGLARVATLRKQLLKENPNTYTILAGDFLSPSLLGTLKYQGQRIKGRHMVEVLNALGVDLVTFGNHEFDLKEQELQQRINESKFDWVSANVYHHIDGENTPFAKIRGKDSLPIPRWVEQTFDNGKGGRVTVGFFGVTLPFSRKPWVFYDNVWTTARQAVDALKKDCDVIIPITHLEVKDDQKLGMQLPEASLILGGHDHNHMLKKAGFIKVAKADANARSVYIHRFTWFADKDSLALQSELVVIDTSFAFDPKVQAVVKKWERIQDELFAREGFDKDEVLVTIQGVAEGRESAVRYGQTNLGQMIARAMVNACPEADCAVLNSGSIRLDDQLSGAITQYDILRTLPFGGGIVEVEMPGSLLLKVLNTGEGNAGTGGYLQRAMVKKDYERESWIINGHLLDTTATYRVAMTEFLMTGMETNFDFMNRDNPELKIVFDPAGAPPDDLRADIRKAVIAYLKRLNK